MVDISTFAGDCFNFIGRIIGAFFNVWFSFYNRIGFLNAILAMIFSICVFRFVVVPFVGSAHFNVGQSMQHYREARDLKEKRSQADAERAERNKRNEEFIAARERRNEEYHSRRMQYLQTRINKNKKNNKD